MCIVQLSWLHLHTYCSLTACDFCPVKAFLPVTFTASKASLLDDVLSRWSKGHDFQLQAGVRALKQKSWEQLRALAAANQLVDGCYG